MMEGRAMLPMDTKITTESSKRPDEPKKKAQEQMTSNSAKRSPEMEALEHVPALPDEYRIPKRKLGPTRSEASKSPTKKKLGVCDMPSSGYSGSQQQREERKWEQSQEKRSACDWKGHPSYNRKRQEDEGNSTDRGYAHDSRSCRGNRGSDAYRGYTGYQRGRREDRGNIMQMNAQARRRQRREEERAKAPAIRVEEKKQDIQSAGTRSSLIDKLAATTQMLTEITRTLTHSACGSVAQPRDETPRGSEVSRIVSKISAGSGRNAQNKEMFCASLQKEAA